MLHGVKGSLFESRWGEVLQFVRFLVDVLPLMASSWDARKYKSYAQAREAQAEAQQRAEQRAGNAVQPRPADPDVAFRVFPSLLLVVGAIGAVAQQVGSVWRGMPMPLCIGPACVSTRGWEDVLAALWQTCVCVPLCWHDGS